MKQIFMILTVVLSGLCVYGQQQYNSPNAEKRDVGSFHGIEVSTGVELVLTYGNTEEVAVSAATTEFRDKIITKVKDGILKIYYENKTGAINNRRETKNLKAWVSYKTLDVLNANTGAEVTFNGVIKTASLESDVSTGATIDGEVNVDVLKLNISTGSKLNLKGKATKITIEGNTGSKLMAEDLTSNDCDIKVSTGAQVSVKVENEMVVHATSGGVVKYKGNAVIKEIKMNSGGTVNKLKS
ncbi:MAG: DUF2807 domain-containing protein [Bacteroidetes bacterium]|nr:DUF2807 domain-containing protein [Bacteroidota bacterium]